MQISNTHIETIEQPFKRKLRYDAKIMRLVSYITYEGVSSDALINIINIPHHGGYQIYLRGLLIDLWIVKIKLSYTTQIKDTDIKWSNWRGLVGQYTASFFSKTLINITKWLTDGDMGSKQK